MRIFIFPWFVACCLIALHGCAPSEPPAGGNGAKSRPAATARQSGPTQPGVSADDRPAQTANSADERPQPAPTEGPIGDRPMDDAGPIQAPALVGNAQGFAVPETPPVVLLSDGHAATCKLKVGDVLPTLELQSTAGEPAELTIDLKDPLTVVVFWNDKYHFAREEIDRLNDELASPWSDHGVRVVAIHVGEPPARLGQIAANQPSVEHYVDPEGKAFAEVATGMLPRTYVIDNQRRIRWFDVEYAREMRRELQNAIAYALKGDGEL